MTNKKTILNIEEANSLSKLGYALIFKNGQICIERD